MSTGSESGLTNHFRASFIFSRVRENVMFLYHGEDYHTVHQELITTSSFKSLSFVTSLALASERPPPPFLPSAKRPPSKQSPTHLLSFPLFFSSFDLLIVSSSRKGDTIPLSINSEPDLRILMAPHAELSPPPSPGHEKPAPGRTHSTGLIAHLQRYQLTQDVGSLMENYAPNVLTTTITRGAHIAASLVPTKILSKADSIADSLLAQVDQAFPSLPSMPLSNLTNPPKRILEKTIINPVSAVNTASKVYIDSTRSSITESRKNFRENISRIYKKSVSPPLANMTNPYLAPINSRILESLNSAAPKSYNEALTESPDVTAEPKPEFEKTFKLFQVAVSRARLHVLIPFKSQATHTKEDVVEGGDQSKAGIGESANRICGGVEHLMRVCREEASHEKENGVSAGMRVGRKVGERVAGDVVGTGIMVVAKSVGAAWGVLDAGREKLGI
ncbi:hypothetical protein L873DRAFT_1185750 [Choiromyces venosus 120613-1]|uniref:Uncharacterized protein n=1 Tax=Choiromyces venosus 120613-1 TaxID=1336337 RepID=A0A3N4K6D3_9PEZI|nr:hypothetical protein L873DRAFT_1185750 [Choiromyces venosus 120613-1]